MIFFERARRDLIHRGVVKELGVEGIVTLEALGPENLQLEDLKRQNSK